jgi:metal-responsive CopG/Arc/MetJ family transcriptional regulator
MPGATILRHVSVRIPDALLREAEAIAARRGTLSQFVREAIADHVARDGQMRRRNERTKRAAASAVAS